ncbi:hypothetical protein VKS41_009431 [Umbelopsis sp. WA50703]
MRKTVLLCIQILRYRYFGFRREPFDESTIHIRHIRQLEGTTLSNNSLNRLPLELYVDIGEEISNSRHYEDCAVCLEQFVTNVSQVRKLPCGHIFHTGCIDPWLRDRNGYCPICKTNCHVNRNTNKEKIPGEFESSSTNREDVQQHIERIRTELLPFSEQQSRSM